MDQKQRRDYLISVFATENPMFGTAIPDSERDARRLLRSLMNVRPAYPISNDFLKVQDEYLSEINEERGIVDVDEIPEVAPGFKIWRGDITRIAADAIVNAANSGMTGCYGACHACIDNCIHTYAGVQLRKECDNLMKAQGYPEPTGKVKVTGAYNLPSKYVFHTVGPIVSGPLTDKHKELLASCYLSCLKAAHTMNLKSIAFCCISTGVFCFPNEEAAEIAVRTCKEFKEHTGSSVEVIFNVFLERDESIYRRIFANQ